MIKNIFILFILLLSSFQSYAVSVIDYGADPNGVIDSTTAIQDAINASDEVYFPAGTYRCNSITLDSGSFLHGDGAKSIIKQNAGVPFNINTTSANAYIENVTIRDLQLLGKVVLSGFFEAYHLMKFNGVKNLLVENCYITGFQGDGIYLGGQNNSGGECHNKNIRIVNCTFDGINNNNRNGISIIDGDGVMVSKCSFFNCTRSNMPGCIDIEPNSNAFSRVKNITVNNCIFDNCGGNVGNIGLVIPTKLTDSPKGFIFTNNIFKSNVGVNIVIRAANETHSYNIIISGNVGYDVTRPISITGGDSAIMRGITVTNNTFYHSDIAYFGFGGFQLKDAVITGNIFRTNSSRAGSSFATAEGLSFRNCSNVVVSNNIFDGHSNYGINFGITTSTVSNITVMGNIFNNMVNYAVLMNAEVANPETNLFYNNQLNGAMNKFKAFRTDDNGSITNNIVATTFNTATLPDFFPIGISTAMLNGDIGVPAGTGSTQGILRTYRFASMNKATYQVFYHASNGFKLGSFWLRRRDQTLNAWTCWFEVEGI